MATIEYGDDRIWHGVTLGAGASRYRMNNHTHDPVGMSLLAAWKQSEDGFGGQSPRGRACG
jgi:hypothetical protein